MAEVAKALGDPIRLQLVDVLRKHAGKVCVCELVPLFDLSQPTVSHHLKKLREAGIVDSERAGPVGLLLRHPRRTGGADRMAELRRSRPRAPCCSPERAGDLLRARAPRPSAAARPRRRLRLRRREATETADVRERSASATPPRRRQRAPRLGGAAAPATRSPPSSARSSARASTRPSDRDALPDAAQLASLGCGNPTAVADLHEGETVLDLGSGGGIDVLLSARRVGPTGKAYGLDMTDEMLELARAQPARGRRRERRVPQGHIEDDPAAATTPSTSSSPTA